MPMHETEFLRQLERTANRRHMRHRYALVATWCVIIVGSIVSTVGICECVRLRRERAAFAAEQRAWIANHPKLAAELGWTEGGVHE